MPAEPPKPLTPARVWSCVLINQGATPGLGSVMCGRWVAGLGQLTLAVAGFIGIMLWMWGYFSHLAAQQLDDGTVPPASFQWAGKWGVILFGAAWLWALVTSVSLMRQAKAEEPEIPPHITKPPGQV